MAALFKYFVGIAVILPAVIIFSAVNMSEMFVGIAAIAQAPAAETPRWNIEPRIAEVDTRYVAHGSCVTSAVCTTVRNCMRDEGGPFEAGSQVLVSSHRKLLSSKAMVVNVAETSGQDSDRCD